MKSPPRIIKSAPVPFGKFDRIVFRALERRGPRDISGHCAHAWFATARDKLRDLGLAESLEDGRWRLSSRGRRVWTKLKQTGQGSMSI